MIRYNKRANNPIYYQNTLSYSLLLLSNMRRFPLAFTMPYFCASLSLLIENDLQRQLCQFQSSNQLPTCQKEISKNQIKGCSLQPAQKDEWLNWINPIDQVQSIENLKEDFLLQQIKRYNRSRVGRQDNRRNRKRVNKKERTPRKTRTTITQDKLNELNYMFNEYMKNFEKKSYQNNKRVASYIQKEVSQYEPKDTLNLPLIAQRLGLSFSTILTKYRQFKVTHKVKGGILIASTEKRNYKKSREIQELIQHSLQEKNFFTVSELKDYIMENFGHNCTRSKISRHLSEMGYSFHNLTKIGAKVNLITNLRNQFAISLKLKMLRPNPTHLYYLDSFVFQFNQQSYFNMGSQEEIAVMVFASQNKLIIAQYAKNPISQIQFARFFNEVEQYFMSENTTHKILIMSVKNPFLYSKEVLQARKRLVDYNVLFFYQPPLSRQLNILFWLFEELQKLIREHSFSSLYQFEDFIDEAMKGMMRLNFPTFVQFMRAYLTKCQEMTQF